MEQQFKGIEFDILDQIKKSTAERVKQEQANEEIKLLGTPINKLIPEIYEDKRILPNAFLRSGLFGMVKKGKRALVKDEPIFSMSQYEVTFSGECLDQNDLELWDTLLYIAKERQVDSELRISLYDLCKQMNFNIGKNNYDRLISRTQRLQFGQIKIKKDKLQFGGSLINNYYIDENGDGKLVIEYNKKLMPLFKDKDYTFININIKHQLGDSQLARWLYNFYESHKEPIPFQLDYIQKLCRSSSTPKEFKRLLKNALEHIKQTYLNIELNSKWDYEINNKNYLIIYPNGKNNDIKLPKIQLKTF